MPEKLDWLGKLETETAAVVQAALNLSDSEMERLCAINAKYSDGIGEKKDGFDRDKYDSEFAQEVEKIKVEEPRIGYAYAVFQVGADLAYPCDQVFHETLTAVSEFFTKT